MNRLLRPLVLVVTLVLAVGYAYVAHRLASGAAARIALAVPFVLVWSVPAVYWVRGRDSDGPIDRMLRWASYLSMAWLSFLFVLTVARDALLLATVWPPLARAHTLLADDGVAVVLVGSVIAVTIGAVVAARGPRLRHVDVPIEGLAREFDGFRIAQISDLHVGLSIRERYVERVARLVDELQPDLVALTGDIVDGPVERLARDVAPLARGSRVGPTYFVLGNHDCYSGARPWCAHFRSLGMHVLLNEHAVIERGDARMIVAGVTDPASYLAGIEGPRPDLALGEHAGDGFRLLLAHNPKVAPLAEQAGFDLQLSGHTHAGQFFPWTIAVRLIHAPHVAGLSRQGRMWVYVSAGTGTWGPPVRVGTEPELTVVRLVRV